MSFVAASVSFAIVLIGFTAILNRLVQEASRLKELPGPPSPSRIAGHALDLQLAPVGTRYPAWAKEYGRTYRLHGAFTERHLVLGDPKGISHVLSTRASNYVRPNTDRIVLGLWFGQGLFTAEGDEHAKQRKILNPAFTYQSIQDISHIFQQLGDRLIQQWETALADKDSTTFDIAPALHALTLDAISMSMFMHDTSTTSGSVPISDLLHNITNAPRGNMLTLFLGSIVSMFPHLLSLPSPMKKWATTLRGELGKIAESVWSGTKNDIGLDAKLLKLLSHCECESLRLPGSLTLTAAQQIIGVLFAGSESSANVISETLYELGRHQHVQQKLRLELLEFEQASGHAASFDDLMNPATLPYIDAVIREALRLKAVLMDIARAVADDIIPLQFPVAGTGATSVRVEAGQSVMIPVRDGINSDEGIWGSDAREFRPERWLDNDIPEAVASIQAQGHTLTFGHGPKVCLGRTFAIAEIKMVVAAVVRRFSVEDAGVALDFYHLGGNTVKPKIRGREEEGVQLPLRVRSL
ncbi:cytochrome P450 [Heliocybe sulcata]|uniref:Cytochrome P450 n=1 Tax=Heliocybe sulcata TaxID=5364 RepID=A0A5C3N6W7_9AGAM|nr:cytochrome P450 [Heliocybe sulcata]